ncbi:hypothetical protein Purlil1_12321 [Purpureocillium lilacinum]|uniref:Uncharacterized protein n=1 Tax=Purpureocillium lilacinum TaxID=33203 RepID=A0ABR0BH59_PURLI|nr:hypothetical protein Purlil1_12321 [Purpureocillium lilacinum]
MYIAPSAPRQINIPSRVRDSLLSKPSDPFPPDPSELDEACRIVYELMNDSLLIPFLQSAAPARLASTSQERDGPTGPPPPTTAVVMSAESHNHLGFSSLRRSRGIKHRRTGLDIENIISACCLTSAKYNPSATEDLQSIPSRPRQRPTSASSPRQPARADVTQRVQRNHRASSNQDDYQDEWQRTITTIVTRTVTSGGTQASAASSTSTAGAAAHVNPGNGVLGRRCCRRSPHAVKCLGAAPDIEGGVTRDIFGLLMRDRLWRDLAHVAGQEHERGGFYTTGRARLFPDPAHKAQLRIKLAATTKWEFRQVQFSVVHAREPSPDGNRV